MSSISEGFVLRKVTSFATMGLMLATVANLAHSASAANRGGLWAVVHDICVPAYLSIGVGFPCAEVSIADGLERGFAVLRAPSSATHVIVVPYRSYFRHRKPGVAEGKCAKLLGGSMGRPPFRRGRGAPSTAA
jgi:CDP-diacylglycerol pyrophosphatase